MIKPEVLENHIAFHPEELPLIKRLEPDFDVTWAKRFKEFNAQVSAYFLKPLNHISEAFGFEHEICLIYSPFPKMEARTIQALDRIMSQTPALGRVDQANAFLISDDRNVHDWLRDYAAANPQSRIVVGFSTDELKSSSDAWDVRNWITSQLYSRDLFDYTLPIDNDTFFFGRGSDVAEHVDAIRRSENRGLFGLRKSGKTSLLFKIQRECERSSLTTVYVDCKLPHIYRKSCDELLQFVTDEIATKSSLSGKGWSSKKDASDRFFRMVEKLAGRKVCVIFDEIEYISFFSPVPQASHWHEDFIPFWQTLWATQSQYRNLSFIITGVNASVVELDTIRMIQNPMFGIVKHRYLQGLSLIDVRQMLKVLGRRMGMRFDDKAAAFLFERYGGHPLVTRMICSNIHSQIRAEGLRRPFLIEENFLRQSLDDREEEVIIYCNHIVSELKNSYPDEYDMLEFLAIDDIDGFNSFADDEGYIRHLKGYGLVEFDVPLMPRFKIPVLKKFIAREWKRRSGKSVPTYIPPSEHRAAFVRSRCTSILRDMRSLNTRLAKLQMPTLYGTGGPSEAEKYADSVAAGDMPHLTSFLIQSARSLIEPIDQHGHSQSKKKDAFFYGEIKQAYPDLWNSLNRIRSYRNWLGHLELNAEAERQFKEYIAIDLGGKSPENIEDGAFILQSICLNSLAISIQSTFARYE